MIIKRKKRGVTINKTRNQNDMTPLMSRNRGMSKNAKTNLSGLIIDLQGELTRGGKNQCQRILNTATPLTLQDKHEENSTYLYSVNCMYNYIHKEIERM